MIDDRVNAEKLAEGRKQREAAETATDDGMPVAPDMRVKDIDVTQDGTPKRWVKHTRTWFGDGPMQSGRPVIVRRKADLS
jgi:hypothetical protein